MAKRFTDSDKWKKIWFRTLSPINKCLWLYLCDNCDHAGIWEVDFQTAEYFIGEKLDIETIKEVFKKQYIEIENNKKWFIKDFVVFQYGELNPENRAHRSVISRLSGVVESSQFKGLIRGLEGCKDKDKDKDMDKDKDKVNTKDKDMKKSYGEYNHVLLTNSQYEKLKARFGDKGVSDQIKRLDEGIQMKGYKYKDHYLAILKWVTSDLTGFNGEKISTPIKQRRTMTQSEYVRINDMPSPGVGTVISGVEIVAG